MKVQIFAYRSERERNSGDLNGGEFLGETEDPEELDKIVRNCPNYVDRFFAFFDDKGERFPSVNEAYIALGRDPKELIWDWD